MDMNGWGWFRRISLAVVVVAAFVFSSTAAAQPAPNARPAGGAVVGGNASIATTANSTTVTQTSELAVVNWQSFNVGSRQSVVINEPSSSALTLMRVTGPNPSQWAGRVTSNGQLVIVNQSGAVLDKGVQVNTQSFVIAVPNVSTTNFMHGHMNFDQPGRPNAQVTNAGQITTRQAGLMALLAPSVGNSGTVTARLGSVDLISAKTANFALYGDSLFGVAADMPVVQAPIASNGKPVSSLIRQTGVITAKAGAVTLYATAADGVINSLVSNTGQINADTVGSHTGSIRVGGVGGSMTVAGQLQARGQGPGYLGGKIQLLSSNAVVVNPTASVDASGAKGSGTVAIGTTLTRASGGPSVTGQRTSRKVQVAKGALIAANATGNGNGGKIVGLSSQTTIFHGTASVTGGATAGNGGLIELSGPTLDVAGATLDTSAPHGTSGTVLLDPRKLIL